MPAQRYAMLCLDYALMVSMYWLTATEFLYASRDTHASHGEVKNCLRSYKVSVRTGSPTFITQPQSSASPLRATRAP
jgi:hypothetical protein